MALGLNIVVGFAGLLDLGYVAFFAFGAYTMGWLGSGFFVDASGEEGIHIASSATRREPARHPRQLPARPGRGVIITAIAGVVIGLPTLRLRGDYIADRDARLRRDHRPHRDQRRRAQDRRRASSRTGARASRRWTRSTSRSSSRSPRSTCDPGTGRARARPGRAVRELPPARLAPGPRLDRAARGRGARPRAWACRSCKTKLLAYATGAAFGGVAGAFLGSYLNTVNADQFQFSFSIFMLAMVDPRRPRDRSGAW